MSMPPPPPPPGSVPPPPPGYQAYQSYQATPSYAGWGSRFGGAIVDGLISFGFQLPGVLVAQGSSALGSLLQLAGLVAFVVLWSKQIGTTGQSWGKKAVGIRVVDAQSGQAIGQGRAVGRYFAQILSALPCYLGFLWPLWDDKKQSFHDKIVGTIVVKA
jgi:uncharacterized RDD family membrane protein YckC